MEKSKIIIYWVTTILMSVGMFGTGLAQVIHSKQMIDIVIPLGYPLYFLNIIGVWKMLAVIVILIPGFKLVKEWAYAGLFFVMTGAVVSHLASSDYAIKGIIGPLMQTVFIILSWHFRPVNRKIIVPHARLV